MAFMLAARSPAWSIGLWGAPGVAIAFNGSNFLPNKSVELFLVSWAVLAIVFALVRGSQALPMRLLFAPPVLLSLGLAVLMVSRLSGSPAREYGSFKLQLFLAENITILVAAILIGGSGRALELWVGLALLTDTASALVLTHGLVVHQTQVESVGGRFALYQSATPIGLGRQTAAGLLLAAFVLLSFGPLWRRFLAIGAIPFLAVAFAASGSRGPVLGLVCGLVLLIVLNLSDRQSRRRLGLLVLGALGAGVLVPQLVPGGNVGRAFSVLIGGTDQGGSFSNGRIHLWGQAWHAFTSHPFLGVGTGGFGAINPDELYPHNLLLETAAEVGVIGLVFVLGILGFTGWMLRQAYVRSSGDDRRRAALVAALFGAALVNASVSGDITTNAPVWLAAGLALGLARRLAPEAPFELLTWSQERLRTRRPAAKPSQRGAQLIRESREARDERPAREAGRRGSIVSPARAASVHGLVPIAVEPARTGSGIEAVLLERSVDGRNWTEIAAAGAEEFFEVHLVSRGAGERRRRLGVIHTRERAEELKSALEAEHAGGPERIEIAPSQRRPASGDETYTAVWDTRVVEDGLHRLRPVTVGSAGRRVLGSETIVTVDNTPPEISRGVPEPVELLDPGPVLAGSVELGAGVGEPKPLWVEYQACPSGSFDWRTLARSDEVPFAAVVDTTALPDGEYDLRVLVGRSEGEVEVSRALRRRVVNRPVAVLLREPPPGAWVAGRVGLGARTSGKPESIRFAYSVDGETWQPIDAGNWETAGLADGDYLLRAEADGPSGTRATSDAVEVHVDNTPPATTIASPLEMSVLRGSARVTAVAVDSGSGVAGVDFEYARADEVWEAIGSTSEAPFGILWETSGVPDGAYLLRGVARDRVGNRAPSGTVAVTVANLSLVSEPEQEPGAPTVPPAASASAPAPDRPRLTLAEAASLWQLERLVEEQSPDDPRREEREALVYSLRSVARPDGAIPEAFWSLVEETFGDLLA